MTETSLDGNWGQTILISAVLWDYGHCSFSKGTKVGLHTDQTKSRVLLSQPIVHSTYADIINGSNNFHVHLFLATQTARCKGLHVKSAFYHSTNCECTVMAYIQILT